MLMFNPLLILLQSLPFQLPTTTHFHVLKHQIHLLWLAVVYPKRKCYFCGGAPHNRLKYLARESVCHDCEIQVHFSRVCRSKKKPGKTSGNVATMYVPTLCALGVTTAFPNSLSYAALPAVIAISPTTRNIFMALTTLKNVNNRSHV